MAVSIFSRLTDNGGVCYETKKFASTGARGARIAKTLMYDGGLVFDFRADVGVTLDGGVSVWEDATKAYTVVQGTSTKRPTQLVDENGHSYIRFNGSTHFLKSPAQLTGGSIVSSSGLFFLVVRQESHTVNEYMFHGNWTGANNPRLMQNPSFPYVRWMCYDAAGNAGPYMADLTPATLKVLTIIQGSGAESKIKVNLGTWATAAYAGRAMDCITFGATSAGTVPADMSLYRARYNASIPDDAVIDTSIKTLMSFYRIT